jgi:hypothetical protein
VFFVSFDIFVCGLVRMFLIFSLLGRNGVPIDMVAQAALVAIEDFDKSLLKRPIARKLKYVSFVNIDHPATEIFQQCFATSAGFSPEMNDAGAAVRRPDMSQASRTSSPGSGAMRSVTDGRGGDAFSQSGDPDYQSQPSSYPSQVAVGMKHPPNGRYPNVAEQDARPASVGATSSQYDDMGATATGWTQVSKFA